MGRVPTAIEIEDGFDAGNSVREIASRFGCSARAVRLAAHAGGVTLPQAARRQARWELLDDEGWLRDELVDHGRSYSAIAGELGCDTAAVRQRAAEIGVDRRTPRCELAHPRLYEPGWLAGRLAAGVSLRAVADEAECSLGAVRYAVGRLGIVERRPHAELRFPLLHDARWLRTQWSIERRTIDDIAAQLGCAPSSVSEALRAHRLDRRPRRRRPSPERLDQDWQLLGSIEAVARVNDIDRQRAELWLAEAGVFRPGAPHLPGDRLAAGLAAGLTVAEIASQLSTTSHRVRVELLRHRLVAS